MSTSADRTPGPAIPGASCRAPASMAIDGALVRLDGPTRRTTLAFASQRLRHPRCGHELLTALQAQRTKTSSRVLRLRPMHWRIGMRNSRSNCWPWAHAPSTEAAVAGITSRATPRRGGRRARPDRAPPARKAGYTLQLLNGARLAERTGRPVVCDFRSADVAAGRPGRAPWCPAFHARRLFASRHPCSGAPSSIMGGIANVSLLVSPRVPIARLRHRTRPTC
jgi:1,6-anhydro-N-acetylmuramate kinase